MNCPHCQHSNEDAGNFCVECGKALPSAAPSGPRVVTGNAVADTEIGRSVQSDELHKQAGKAFAVLLTLVILITVSIFLMFIQSVSKGGAARVAAGASAPSLVLALIYLSLAIWARKNPLPAALAGLVVFASLMIVGLIGLSLVMVLIPRVTIRSHPLPSSAIIPVLVLFCSLLLGIAVGAAIVVRFVRAIKAGLKHRQLQERM